MVMSCNVECLSQCCRSDVLPPFLKLLRDSEAEVRVAAASKVASISNLLELDAVCTRNVLCHGFQYGDTSCFQAERQQASKITVK